MQRVALLARIVRQPRYVGVRSIRSMPKACGPTRRHHLTLTTSAQSIAFPHHHPPLSSRGVALSRAEPSTSKELFELVAASSVAGQGRRGRRARSAGRARPDPSQTTQARHSHARKCANPCVYRFLIRFLLVGYNKSRLSINHQSPILVCNSAYKSFPVFSFTNIQSKTIPSNRAYLIPIFKDNNTKRQSCHVWVYCAICRARAASCTALNSIKVMHALPPPAPVGSADSYEVIV